MSNLVDEEPTCFEEALKKKEWMQAMIEEYQWIINNDVWDVVAKTKGQVISFFKMDFQGKAFNKW